MRVKKLTTDKSTNRNPRRVRTDKFVALSRSYFVLFYPVACQETVNSCRYLRGIQFVNQTSIHENHQGKRKKRAKCLSGVSGSCVVAARQMVADIDEIIVIVERSVRPRNHPTATTNLNSGAVSSVSNTSDGITSKGAGKRRQRVEDKDRLNVCTGRNQEGCN